MKNEYVFIVGGGKGGVGKSTITIGLADYLIEKQEKFTLLESDSSNPDTIKTLHNKVPCTTFNLDKKDSFIDLGMWLESGEGKEGNVIINTAARTTTAMVEYAEELALCIQESGRKAILFWPMNRQIDCLVLLMDFLKKEESFDAVYPIKNLYFGDPEKFVKLDSFMESEREDVKPLSSKVTKILQYPDLNDNVMDKIVNSRKLPSEIMESLGRFERIPLKKYIEEVHSLFDSVIE